MNYTPGGSPIHHYQMKQRVSKNHHCPFCLKDETKTKRQRTKKYTAEGCLDHIKSVHTEGIRLDEEPVLKTGRA